MSLTVAARRASSASLMLCMVRTDGRSLAVFLRMVTDSCSCLLASSDMCSSRSTASCWMEKREGGRGPSTQPHFTDCHVPFVSSALPWLDYASQSRRSGWLASGAARVPQTTRADGTGGRAGWGRGNKARGEQPAHWQPEQPPLTKCRMSLEACAAGPSVSTACSTSELTLAPHNSHGHMLVVAAWAQGLATNTLTQELRLEHSSSIPCTRRCPRSCPLASPPAVKTQAAVMVSSRWWRPHPLRQASLTLATTENLVESNVDSLCSFSCSSMLCMRLL